MSARSGGFACDSSVIIGALVDWNPRQADFLQVVDGKSVMLPEHVYLEVYSALTRMPRPHRISGRDAAAAISGLRPTMLHLPQDKRGALVRDLATARVTGGAAYDGLVGITAQHHGLTLLTADRRARSTYEALGVRYQLV
jgi:predicted nucleic acid-binding protein